MGSELQGYMQFLPFVLSGVVSGFFLIPNGARNILSALLFVVLLVVCTVSVIVIQQALSLKTYDPDTLDLFISGVMLLVTYFSQVCAYFFKAEFVRKRRKQKT
ncbi:hypothetical protein [Alteromonas gracilis]|uniref:hypothetical protein n=1 Tax=Alteromonas gracilis TaxID=1479524 RepID=UPI0030D49AAF